MDGDQIRNAVRKNWAVIDDKAGATSVATRWVAVLGVLTLALGAAVNVGI